MGLGCGGSGVSKISGVESEPFVTAGGSITSLAFAPDGRLFLTQQNNGDVRIITPDGELLPEPFAHVDPATGGEWGLLGVAIDPEFEDNGYVYIYYTEPAGGENLARPVLMRFTDVDNEGENPERLIEFPTANPEVKAHVGGGLHFGPDGYLYLSIGETERRELAQDLSSPLGKMLRLTRDGEAAPDNPFVDQPGADPRVYAYGLRNSFAFDFDPESGRIYASENGPSTCDELNIIEAGQNYGWPESFFTQGPELPCENPGAVEPIYLYALPGKEPNDLPSNVGPAGVQFVSGEVYPALGDGLLVCEFNTKFMRRLQFSGPANDQVIDDSVAVEDCAVAITSDSDGVIYYSNRGDILRLVPQ
jgi:glucose/arabinose dehydrogenase